jgi:hypothetical protein
MTNETARQMGARLYRCPRTGSKTSSPYGRRRTIRTPISFRTALRQLLLQKPTVDRLSRRGRRTATLLQILHARVPYDRYWTTVFLCYRGFIGAVLSIRCAESGVAAIHGGHAVGSGRSHSHTSATTREGRTGKLPHRHPWRFGAIRPARERHGPGRRCFLSSNHPHGDATRATATAAPPSVLDGPGNHGRPTRLRGRHGQCARRSMKGLKIENRFASLLQKSNLAYSTKTARDVSPRRLQRQAQRLD